MDLGQCASSCGSSDTMQADCPSGTCEDSENRLYYSNTKHSRPDDPTMTARKTKDFHMEEIIMDQKRTWLYYRIDKSGPDGAQALDWQRFALESYAREHGLEIAGSSGDIDRGLTLDRPGLREFHAAVEDGKADILLVHSLSHLGRDPRGVAEYWCRLRDLGVSVHTADRGEVDLGPDGTVHDAVDAPRETSLSGIRETGVTI